MPTRRTRKDGFAKDFAQILTVLAYLVASLLISFGSVAPEMRNSVSWPLKTGHHYI